MAQEKPHQKPFVAAQTSIRAIVSHVAHQR